MQKLITSLALVFFAFVVCISAQEKRVRGGRGWGRGRPRGGLESRLPAALKEADQYNWEVDADSNGTLIPQRGFIIPEENVVAIITISRDLRALNMTSSILYINATSGVMVIKQLFRRRSPCFLMSTSITMPDLESDFNARNDSQITLPQIASTYNGTGTPMTPEEAAAELEGNKAVTKLCRRGGLIQLTSMSGTEEDPDTRMLTILGYQSEVSIMVPAMAPRRVPGGRRPGGQRPGGRGQGGRGQRPGGRGQGGRGQGGRGRGGRRDRGDSEA